MNMINTNQAAITTKYVLYDHSVIVSVYHDMDDDWQFYGVEEVETEDAVLLSISQIIELDASVKEILNIKKGYSAHRNSKIDSWRIEKDE
ncbi:MAG: hypothetical protein J5554_01600 [Paludibacteraceae bacterium]|nr:hypothetical protein [Paludibacteraceae bacterium]